MGQILVNDALPEDMRDHGRVLDKKGINALLREVAQKYPDKYVEVSKKLSDIGRGVATDFGGYTFGLEHLKKSKAGKAVQADITAKMKRILDDDKITDTQRHDMIVKAVGGSQQKQIDDIYAESVADNNPLAMQVVSGSRGNRMNLSSMLGSDMLYDDHRGETIPLPVTSSYSQGLRPVEYWAATYGARRGTMATKFATQDAGFLSKQLNQINHRLTIVGDDDEREGQPDRGLPVDTDDADNEGALLAKDVGPYKRNTVISPKIAKHLKGLGHDRILVRSPLVGGSPDGGVYARDVGIRERGVLPGRGEQVGLTAAQSLSEPLAQGQLSSKHSGGVAGQEKAVGGFAYINQLIQVPKKFKGGAAHAEHDGTVSSVVPAPAGGNYVWIDDKRHYVPADSPLKVKKGDSIEAGDVISEGFPNPAVVTKHKGVGEGKRYFVNAFRTAMNDAGMKVNRRNVELLARGLINHVRLTDEHGDHVPDDVVPYSTMESQYEPREGHARMKPDRALGKYLERPVLHYSIGTKIRPSVQKELGHFGIGEIAVHQDPPPFEAEMIRGMYSLQNDPDWMTRMYGSGLKGSLLDSVHHGGISDEQGTSFVPSLARAADFGRTGGAVRVPEAGTPPPPEGQPFGDPRKIVKPVGIDAPEPPKKKGLLGGIFKMSDDERAAAVMRVAGISAIRTKRAEAPAKPKVTTTMAPSMGSSTDASATDVRTISAAPPAEKNEAALDPKQLAAGPKPSAISAPAGLSNALPEPPRGDSAPPGQVHPARERYNPNAFEGGYVPGNGILQQMDDPEMAAQFVQGGGERSNPSGGFGGELGAVTRFGSLLDMNAVSTLTGGGEGYAGGGNAQPADGYAQPGGGQGGHPWQGQQPQWVHTATGTPPADPAKPADPSKPLIDPELQAGAGSLLGAAAQAKFKPYSPQAAGFGVGREVFELGKRLPVVSNVSDWLSRSGIVNNKATRGALDFIAPRLAGQTVTGNMTARPAPTAPVAGAAEKAVATQAAKPAAKFGLGKAIGLGLRRTPIGFAMDGADELYGLPEDLGGRGWAKGPSTTEERRGRFDTQMQRRTDANAAYERGDWLEGLGKTLGYTAQNTNFVGRGADVTQQLSDTAEESTKNVAQSQSMEDQRAKFQAREFSDPKTTEQRRQQILDERMTPAHERDAAKDHKPSQVANLMGGEMKYDPSKWKDKPVYSPTLAPDLFLSQLGLPTIGGHQINPDHDPVKAREAEALKLRQQASRDSLAKSFGIPDSARPAGPANEGVYKGDYVPPSAASDGLPEDIRRALMAPPPPR